MTPKLIIALCLSWVISSCDLDEDLIYPNDSISGESREELGSNFDWLIRNRSVIDTCMRITSTHWLMGSKIDPQPLQKAQPESGVFTLPYSTKYTMEARGDAMSEYLARGFSELQLVYNAPSRKLTGTLITQFYFGEVLEMKFNSNAELSYSGQTIHMTVKVEEAILRSDVVSLHLESGEIHFAFLNKPGGVFLADVQTDGAYCIQ